MIITGYAIEEKECNYRIDFLYNGKEAIQEFPTLFSMLGDFPYFDEEKYDFNIFLFLASTSNYDIFLRAPNKESYEKLQQYEFLLQNIKFDDFKKDRRKDIIKKINSFDKQQNHSIMLELDLLRQLKEHKNINHVFYNDLPDSNHDYRISLGGIDFNLELTGLGESEPNKILRNSFSKIAKELLNVIPADKMLKIDIKTDKLLNEKNRMDEGHIFRLIIDSIKNIWPIISIKNNSYCRINANALTHNGNIYEIRQAYKYFNDFGERLALLCGTQEGEAYLKNTHLSIFDDFPVSSFGFFDAKFKLVEIQSQSFFPSTAENLRELSLLNQLERIVDSKLKKNQLSGQENSIIVIYFQDMLFRGYSDGREIFSDKYLEKIKKRTLDALIKNPEYNNILGIMLIEDSLDNSKFVPNPNIALEPSILSKLELMSQII